MRTKRLFGLIMLVVLGLGRMSVADPLYTWVQVVERGMPDFNDQAVAGKGYIATIPLHLSFPSGVHVVFVFVKHQGHTYAVYHHGQTKDVVGIGRLDWDPAWPQGMHFYEFYVDTGLLEGHALTGRFLYMGDSDRIFEGMCRIAQLSNEARPHADCPGPV
ncbi:MAG: hypothetical protein ACE5IQ_10325 [Candidatus Methylomirabilales bacterium]